MIKNQTNKYSRKRRRQNANWMPVLLAAGGVLLVLLAFFAIRPKPTPKVPVEASGSPSLKVDKEKVDLGDVKLGNTVEVSFQLTNIGDQNLRFTEQPYVEVVEGC